ncbi:XkdQ/YqbQ family protein [Clostridium uliginosum]|uniref:YqbQ/XkdQ domain-containing protein n=1 Tax=Clostridium uliginosum TaxID=119641 RepID=A0A1I1KRZ5_9CLOT|nr:hypothetical protein [Clostridium uliginosum]SFC63604.1 hypothetical protein SAMN05421842_106132 [Clostridium uliginosum]
MKIELLIDDKKGNIFDISDLVREVTWKTKRKDSPSSLDISLLEDTSISISNGDIVRFRVDKVNIFYGYIFKNAGDEGPEIKLNAYDQIKYLMYNDTYAFANIKASDIVSKVADKLGLRKGSIEDTEYVIPIIQESDKKLLDIIYKALEKTLIANTKTFVLYDEFGSLNLKDINNMRQEIIISDDTNLGKYDWSKSIEESYNRIKFVKKNEKTGQKDVYIAQDSSSIYKWGKLQFFKSIDDKLNKAEIEQMLDGNLKLKNKESKTLKLKNVLGTDTELEAKLRGGAGVFVDIKRHGINQCYLIEEATHKFSKDGHTMDFNLKVV